MSHQLINRNPDLRQLLEEHFDIEVRSNHLLVKGVPYVNSERKVRRGTLVCPLGDISGDTLQPPSDHTIYFAGEHPCHADGTIIHQIRLSTETTTLARGVVVHHKFSAKPKIDGKYRDYYHKIVTYVALLSSAARSFEPMATAQTNVVMASTEEDESPFNYPDTAPTRDGIQALTAVFNGQKIAIVGAGGTGAYVLDLVAKTPVAEIHIFDGDYFSNHNAFRAPGAPSIEELAGRPLKATYLQERYLKMHRGVKANGAYLTEENVDQLQAIDFVFLCLDRGQDKKVVVERLEAWNRPFIDVGMGVDTVGNALRGQVRVTLSTPQRREHFRVRSPFTDGGVDNDYSRNIQIADLNSLNAALAVIKWKKWCGFYQDLDKEHCCLYTINGNHLANTDTYDPNTQA